MSWNSYFYANSWGGLPITGYFDSGATPVWVGSPGVSVVKNAVGVYTLTYPTAFLNVPSVVCQIRDMNPGFAGYITVSAASTTTCTIRGYAAPAIVAFDFQIINVMIG